MTKASIPQGLKANGKAFWLQAHKERVFEEVHDLERLAMAAKCLDDLNMVEARVKKDGMYVTNRYGNVVEHPGVKSIKDFRLLFVKIVRELGLDLMTSDDIRPPRQY